MEDKKLVETWQMKGRTYDKRNSTDPVYIPIKESEVLVGSQFGEAIDARLAISYIRDLWKAVAGDKFLSYWDNNEADGSYLVEAISGRVDRGNIDVDKLKKELRSFMTMSAIAAGWAKELLHNSFALTVKKSLILKVLSQPTCEGLRFYLCMKNYRPRVSGELPEPNKIIYPSGNLALVTVGIDILERDLHYDYTPYIHKETGTDDIPNIENTSLSLEYPTRPEKGIFGKDLNSQELKPYTLFQYSRRPDNKSW